MATAKQGTRATTVLPPRISVRVRKPVGRPKRAPVETNTRSAILEAALESLAENAFDHESLASIAARAGVSQPLVNYHFATKEALWRESVSSAFTRLRGAIDVALASVPESSKDKPLERVLTALMTGVATTPAVSVVFFNESARATTRFRWVVGSQIAPIVKVLERVLCETKFRADEDARRHTVLAMLASACFLPASTRLHAFLTGRRRPRKDDEGAYARTVLRAFAHA
ncbi:MAG: TetR/AcrR family transcriptional regulator [Polyangiaceae bacterium]